MKIKNIFGVALATIAAFSLASCSDKVEYTPAEALTNAQVYFPSTNPSEISLDMDATSYGVTLARVKTDDDLTVNLAGEITADGSIGEFNIPSSVTFAKGASSVEIPITYDGAAIGYDNPIHGTITISDATYTTPYGTSSYSFTANIPAPWKSIGTGTYIDHFIGCLYGVDDLQYEVEVQENEQVPGYYRLVYPYDGKYGYNDEGDWDDSQTYYLEIHAEDPEAVYINTQALGIDWGYGMIYGSTLAGYYKARGDEASAEPYYGRLEDGFISFPADSYLMGMANYNSGSLYAGGSAEILLALPGYTIADYSCAVEYTGKFEDVAKNVYAVGNVTLGADVASAKVAVVEGKDATAEAYNGIMNESIDNVVEITEAGEVKVAMPENAQTGYYTMEVVTFNADGVAQADNYVTFKYVNADTPAANWDLTKPLVGTYTYAQFFEGDDEGLTMTPNGDGTFTISNWGYGVDFTFTLNDDNTLTFDDQFIGYTHSTYGDVYIRDLGLYDGMEAGTYSPEEGVFTFQTYYFVEAGYFGYGPETFTITGYADSSAKAAKAAKKSNKKLAQRKAQTNNTVSRSTSLGKSVNTGLKDKKPVIK